MTALSAVSLKGSELMFSGRSLSLYNIYHRLVKSTILVGVEMCNLYFIYRYIDRWWALVSTVMNFRVP
jgi:hypothetical protein